MYISQTNSNETTFNEQITVSNSDLITMIGNITDNKDSSYIKCMSIAAALMLIIILILIVSFLAYQKKDNILEQK